jgi:hypothetical protein
MGAEAMSEVWILEYRDCWGPPAPPDCWHVLTSCPAFDNQEDAEVAAEYKQQSAMILEYRVARYIRAEEQKP